MFVVCVVRREYLLAQPYPSLSDLFDLRRQSRATATPTSLSRCIRSSESIRRYLSFYFPEKNQTDHLFSHMPEATFNFSSTPLTPTSDSFLFRKICPPQDFVSQLGRHLPESRRADWGCSFIHLIVLDTVISSIWCLPE